jgi:DNA-binding response OmpR family regulator
MLNLLLVEDDAPLAFVIKDNLELAGYQVAHASTGTQGKQLFEQQIFDLAIVDVMLPELDGFSLAQIIKNINAEFPIVFLTAKSLNTDRIQGLKLGADDYLTKPFNMEELLLRLKAILKRTGKKTFETIVAIGSFQFDTLNLKLSNAQISQNLTHREAELLKLLLSNKNQTISREQILIKLWGDDDYFKGRSLDVFITRLRKYLSHDPSIRLNNVHGVGFRLDLANHQ